jgi:mutual gliding-motility protein MglA
MPYISSRDQTICFKVVYAGASLSGKTTNIEYLHKALAADRKGQLVSLDNEEERTLFFDFFPVSLGQTQGYKVNFQMYSVPGQSYFEASRRLVLDGADAVVFVVDSEPERMDDNLRSFQALRECLSSSGRDLAAVPIVLQYNKRDCDNPAPLGSVEQQLGLEGVPVFQSVATTGEGVMETAHKACTLAIERFQV